MDPRSCSELCCQCSVILHCAESLCGIVDVLVSLNPDVFEPLWSSKVSDATESSDVGVSDCLAESSSATSEIQCIRNYRTSPVGTTNLMYQARTHDLWTPIIAERLTSCTHHRLNSTTANNHNQQNSCTTGGDLVCAAGGGGQKRPERPRIKNMLNKHACKRTRQNNNPMSPDCNHPPPKRQGRDQLELLILASQSPNPTGNRPNMPHIKVVNGPTLPIPVAAQVWRETTLATVYRRPWVTEVLCHDNARPPRPGAIANQCNECPHVLGSAMLPHNWGDDGGLNVRCPRRGYSVVARVVRSCAHTDGRLWRDLA